MPLQYGNGDFAPGIVYGETGKWRCGHNLLLAHAKAVKIFREGGYKAKHDGRIGMALWSEWSEPWTQSEGGEVDALRGRGQGVVGEWMSQRPVPSSIHANLSGHCCMCCDHLSRLHRQCSNCGCWLIMLVDHPTH